MRRGGGLEDLASGAVALVGQTRLLEPRDGLVVQAPAAGLVDHPTVPVETDRREIRELALLRAGTHPVEILDADQEPAVRRPREQPRQDGGAQIAEMQVAGGTRCEATRSCFVLVRK